MPGDTIACELAKGLWLEGSVEHMPPKQTEWMSLPRIGMPQPLAAPAPAAPSKSQNSEKGVDPSLIIQSGKRQRKQAESYDASTTSTEYTRALRIRENEEEALRKTAVAVRFVDGITRCIQLDVGTRGKKWVMGRDREYTVDKLKKSIHAPKPEALAAGKIILYRVDGKGWRRIKLQRPINNREWKHIYQARLGSGMRVEATTAESCETDRCTLPPTGRCQLPPSGRNGNGSAPCALDGGEGKSEKGTPAKPPIGFCGTPGSSKSMNPPPPPPTGGPPAAGTSRTSSRSLWWRCEIVSAVRRRRRRLLVELAEPSRLFCWTFVNDLVNDTGSALKAEEEEEEEESGSENEEEEEEVSEADISDFDEEEEVEEEEEATVLEAEVVTEVATEAAAREKARGGGAGVRGGTPASKKRGPGRPSKKSLAEKKQMQQQANGKASSSKAAASAAFAAPPAEETDGASEEPTELSSEEAKEVVEKALSIGTSKTAATIEVHGWKLVWQARQPGGNGKSGDLSCHDPMARGRSPLRSVASLRRRFGMEDRVGAAEAAEMDDEDIPLSQKKKALKERKVVAAVAPPIVEKPAPPEKKATAPPPASKAAAHPTTPGRSPTRHTRHSAFEEPPKEEAEADAVAEPPPAQPPKGAKKRKGPATAEEEEGLQKVKLRLRPPMALTRDGTPRILRGNSKDYKE